MIESRAISINQRAHAQLGGKPWVYDGRDKPIVMHEWILVPDAFYDDPESLRSWAARAHGAVPGKTLPKKKPRRVAVSVAKPAPKKTRRKG